MFISYYPTYEDLNNMLGEDYEKYKNITIYFDLKNCMTGLFNEKTLQFISENGRDKNYPSGDIFLEWIKYVIYFYKYMKFKSKKINLVFFADVGKSMYHTGIFKEYKGNRSITRFKIISEFEQDLVKRIVKKNIENIMKLGKKIYACNTFYLEYCESDFVPHYIISKFMNHDDDLNLIFSNDSDMMQTLVFDNTKIYNRRTQEHKSILTNKNWHEKLDIPNNIPVENYVYIKSLIGDTADGIPGVKTLGIKKCSKLFENNSIKSLYELRSLIQSSTNISKGMKQTIIDNFFYVERNYQLVSFDELINNLHIDIKRELNNAYDEDVDNSKYDLASTMTLFNQLANKLSY
jgi:5'-3' exonuclease